MKRFRNKALNVMVATDVAARGIDVNDLTHVINVNIPTILRYMFTVQAVLVVPELVVSLCDYTRAQYAQSEKPRTRYWEEL